MDGLKDLSLFGIPILNEAILYTMLFRYLLNFIIVYIIVRKIYYPITNNKDYFFSFFLINTLIFFVCFLMNTSTLNLAVGFGLFAILAIFRYRTDEVPIKEMTYLFMVVILAVINAISTKEFSYSALFATNLIVVGLVWFMEKVWLVKYEASERVIYEKIELIHPSRREELIKDLRERTGFEIDRVRVGRIDLSTDTAQLEVFFKDDR